MSKVREDVIQWIRNWFKENGKDCNGVVGISGGKDSTVVAGLLVEARKAPSDGLCGLTDEDKTGIKYEILDKYIRTGICEDGIIKEKIDGMYAANRFKLEPIPFFLYAGKE